MKLKNKINQKSLTCLEHAFFSIYITVLLANPNYFLFWIKKKQKNKKLHKNILEAKSA